MKTSDPIPPSRSRDRHRARSRVSQPAHPVFAETAPPENTNQGESGPENTNQGESGFTLLEILVVIAILGLLIGLVAPAALRQLSGARVSVANQSIERLASVLDLYKLDVGSYPSTDQGLAALNSKPANVGNWNGPYLKGDGQAMDPWNHPYLYESPASNGRDFALCSKGPNGTATDAASGLICNK